MRGQILGVDRETGDAQVTGDDGKRYRFARHEWDDPVGPSVGALVDFEVADGRAVSVYRVPGSVSGTVAVHAPDRRGASGKNKFVAALLAFILGPIGVHRFYLGRIGSGIAMLVLSCTLVGLLVSVPWAIIDMIRFLIMTHGEFDRRYGETPN